MPPGLSQIALDCPILISGKFGDLMKHTGCLSPSQLYLDSVSSTMLVNLGRMLPFGRDITVLVIETAIPDPLGNVAGNLCTEVAPDLSGSMLMRWCLFVGLVLNHM